MVNSTKKARMTDERRREGIAQRLNELRLDTENNGLNAISQEETAIKLSQVVLDRDKSISGKRVSDWEGGLSEPSINYIIGLAKIFNTTCDYLLTGVTPERVDASRRYGLSNDALKTLENLNSRMDFYIEVADKDNYSYIRPITFINVLLTSDKVREIAVDATKLTYDLILNHSKEKETQIVPEQLKGLEEVIVRSWHDDSTIRSIFETNPHYKNKRIVDFRDYYLSKDYDLNKHWNVLLNDIISNPSLINEGVIHSSTFNSSWLGIPDTTEGGGNSDDNKKS